MLCSGVTIDGVVFRLHRLTGLFLFILFLYVTFYTWTRKPIICNSDFQQGFNDELCLAKRNYKVDREPNVKSEKDEDLPSISYYQWVAEMLFVQAVCFFIPSWLWFQFENKKIKSMVSVIKKGNNLKERVMLLHEYYERGLHQHQMYAFMYLLCHLMNFLNIILQIVYTDNFLDGRFWSYGKNVSRYLDGGDLEDISDPRDLTFPNRIRCSIFRHGASGDLQKHEFPCVLPANRLNEKIYLFLWYWFIHLMIISFLSLCYWIALVIIAPLRKFVLRKFWASESNIMSQNALNTTWFGDWFMLYQLSKNIDGVTISEFLRLLMNRNDVGHQQELYEFKPE